MIKEIKALWKRKIISRQNYVHVHTTIEATNICFRKYLHLVILSSPLYSKLLLQRCTQRPGLALYTARKPPHLGFKRKQYTVRLSTQLGKNYPLDGRGEVLYSVHRLFKVVGVNLLYVRRCWGKCTQPSLSMLQCKTSPCFRRFTLTSGRHARTNLCIRS